MSRSIEVRPSFKVIEGGGQPLPQWLTLPRYVLARSIYKDRAVVEYRPSRVNVNAALEARRYQPILDFWGGVFGEIPSINGLPLICQRAGEAFELTGIAKAHACFRGLRRPVSGDDHGFDFAAYVTKPRWAFERNPTMITPYGVYEVDERFVFLTFVRLDLTTLGQDNKRGKALGLPPSGVITHWGFCEADKDDPTLPVDFGGRFRKRLW